MFDIGFFELIVIGVLALLVLGPERLPKAARTTGVWIGRIKQSFSAIQQEVNQQLHMEEMQRQLDENRRKLEETLRKQEQMMTDSKPPEAPVGDQDSRSSVSSSADQAVASHDVASGQSSSAPVQTSSEMNDSSFGSTPPERKG